MTTDIKTITASSHQSLEGFLIPVIKNIFTVQEYGRLLRMFYGYYKPVEDALETFSLHQVLNDYEHRRKAQLILQDLAAIDQSGPEPLCSHIPVIYGLEEAFGALYVLEGSTLGGQIIKKMLQRNLQRDGEPGFGFFTGYAEDTMDRWKKFKAVLDARYNTDEQWHRLAAAANETFIQLKKWAEYCYRYEPTKEKL